MLVALDLTSRQAERVITQAVRAHAKLEIDPRPEFLDTPLWGSLEANDQGLLVVNLLDGVTDQKLPALVGAMCDVRTILSEQLYLFSTVIVDASVETAPRRCKLAVPESMQVANRRRFTRVQPTEPVPVRVTVPHAPDPVVGSLTNINRTGLGCRITRKVSDDLMLIGDEVQLEFVLPWVNQVYTLPSEVCTKTVTTDHDHIIVGLEFIARTAATRASLELLRAALASETERLMDTDGEVQ